MQIVDRRAEIAMCVYYIRLQPTELQMPLHFHCYYTFTMLSK